MIRVSVLYPNTANTTFDHAYYKTQHFPLLKTRLTPLGLRATGIEKGLAGGAPGSAAPYHAICFLLFDSLGQFQQAFGAHGPELMADIPNYTNVQPVIQISEVVE